ncbi:MAG: molybdopterin molybdotransferase MoeA [Gammaproteobacteria bacterium]|nr:MAG: molybdopterin molybdotransferase MoeA [Gammaproteobacteria bacterium]
MTNSESCCTTGSGLMAVDEAINFLLERAAITTATETIKTEDALGRVLAESLTSKIDVPPLDNSAMDGYALSTNDIASDGKTELPVSQRITAGSTGAPLKPGTAARIFTGAPVPDNANAVVMQERCEQKDDNVLIKGVVNVGDNIRKAGGDIAAGDTILESGVKLRPQELGLAASIGFAELAVYKKLRVAIFSTGDELVLPGEPAGDGKIYNSNRYTLMGLLKSVNCDIVDLGTVPDQLQATLDTLNSASAKADLIITTGGVSVGEEDYIKAALDKLGQVDMWRVAMKPGKPVAFGHVKNTPFIGLPGNPVAVFVTFCLFARPYLLKTQGMTGIRPERLKVKAGFDWNRAGPRREYARAQLQPDIMTATLYPKQGSGVLSSVAWADGLVEIPENSTIKKGDDVTYLSFSDLLS